MDISGNDRRRFLTQMVWGTTVMALANPALPSLFRESIFDNQAFTEPLFDWSAWKKFRMEVDHPCLTFREQHKIQALKNISRFKWAENYAKNLRRSASHYLSFSTSEMLERLIEETTPGDPLWTPCPACRDQGKPVHPHGLWNWDIDKYDQLECTQCGTVFPNSSYPESVVLHTKWGRPQELTFYGGETFKLFGFAQGRPSFSANIRSRKVRWCAGYARLLAEAWLLSEETRYAAACRRILLRMAACYPTWLVHEGYGEYADMDPRQASLHIADLPEPELTPPPNQPDGRLWTGYWSAGRASGVGLESDFIRKVVEAYDMTCTAMDENGRPVYSDDERITIERDLLLESTILLVCDKKMNNKSVSNRTAVGLVGICVGHPGLFRFGLEGFEKTVNEWFLKDGTTSESAFYGLMTLGGIWDFAQASLGYSDPAGYVDPSGPRIQSLNVYHHTAYDRVLEAFFNGLQGDLCYPPYADSFRNLKLDASYVELMVANYPEHKPYLALLKEICGEDLSLPSGPVDPIYFSKDMDRYELATQELPYDLARPNSPSSFSLYFRNPDQSQQPTPRFTLEDWCPAELRIGHMRTGTDGRESLLLLSASHWGSHHEQDSLHLYYWKNGYEILSDLGYLWDHPQESQNFRTVAHNTVVLDESNQRTHDRGGSVVFFRSSPHVKVMEATSEAYAETSIYRRTSAIIDHGGGKNYAVDFFRVEGGEIQDFIFHLSGKSYKMEGLQINGSDLGNLYDFTNIRKGRSDQPWRISWVTDSGEKCTAWVLGSASEEVFVADGWGQRDWKNSDIGAQIPYVVRRCRGNGPKTFITVFEGSGMDSPFVRGVRLIDEKGILSVETEYGEDTILSAFDYGNEPVRYDSGDSALEGHFGVLSTAGGKVRWKFETKL